MNGEISVNTRRVDCSNPNLKTAYFHIWGKKLVHGDRGESFSVTVGVVEDKNGKIHEVYPNYITFLSEQEIKDRRRKEYEKKFG